MLTHAVYKLPVLSLTIDQLGESMKARNAYNLSGATGTIVGAGASSAQVSITVPPANPGAVIPVTGLASPDARNKDIPCPGGYGEHRYAAFTMSLTEVQLR